MKTFRRYGIIAALALIFAALAFFLFPQRLSVSAAAGDVAEVDGVSYSTLDEALQNWKDGTTLKLLASCQTNSTITVGNGTRTLDLDYYSLSLRAGRTGSVLSVRGALTVLGNGEISGGSSQFGGGIDVVGHLSLRGYVRVVNNEGSNIYLSNGNTIDAEGFHGRAGVTAYAQNVPFARGSGSFTSDDPVYTVVEEDGVFSFALSPLAKIQAEFEPTGKIFPTTHLDDLRDGITLTAENMNGAAYPVSRLNYNLSVITTETTDEGTVEKTAGSLSVGENTVRITAIGEGGERAVTDIKVSAVGPALVRITAVYDPFPAIYFDSPLTALHADLTVTGYYEDGRSRDIFPTAEETVAACGESYITDFYTLEGDLKKRDEQGYATVTVIASGQSDTFTVFISKHIISIAGVETRDVTLVEFSGQELSLYDFTPTLPQGITPVFSVNGKPLQAGILNLEAGTYKVVITFLVDDPDNYEDISGSLTATLIINRKSYLMMAGDTVYSSFEKEGGLSPDWKFTVGDVTSSASPELEEGLETKQVFEIELRENGIVVADPGTVTVKLLLSEKLRGKEGLKLFRVRSDGSTVAVTVKEWTEDGYVVFEASEFSKTQYVVAADSNFGAYLGWTITFGVLCVAGAGLLLWYFVFKKKMKIRE